MHPYSRATAAAWTGTDASGNDFRTMRRIQFAEQVDRYPESARRGTPIVSSSASNGLGLPIATVESEKQRLNALFDDIEFFANRLSQAGEALKELERRETLSRQRGGHVQTQDNARLLELARMPNQQEIFEVLREFRAAFNLLAKLRGYITSSPSVSEVMRFLIALLRMILDRTKSTYTGLSEAASVIRPYLTAEAVDLFQYTLTLEQQQFLKNLGPAWWLSEHEAGEHTPPPEAYSVTDGARSPLLLPVYSRQESNTASPRAEPFPVRNARFLEELRARNVPAFEVVAEYMPKRAEELHVQRGEVLEVLSNQRQWWTVRNAANQVGYCPCTILRDITEQHLPPRDYNDENHVTNGHAHVVSNSSPTLNAHVPLPPPPPPPPNMNNSAIPLPPAPAPPPNGPLSPPPAQAQPPLLKPKPSFSASAPAPAPAPANNGHSLQNGRSNAFAHELQARVANKATQPRPLVIPVRIKISQDSTKEEVLEWLNSKRYDKQTIDVLTGINGLELFTLEKNDPQRLLNCKPDDLRKLKDHILLEKNRSGYETIGKRQLKEVLEKRKQQVDPGALLTLAPDEV